MFSPDMNNLLIARELEPITAKKVQLEGLSTEDSFNYTLIKKRQGLESVVRCWL